MKTVAPEHHQRCRQRCETAKCQAVADGHFGASMAGRVAERIHNSVRCGAGGKDQSASEAGCVCGRTRISATTAEKACQWILAMTLQRERRIAETNKRPADDL